MNDFTLILEFLAILATLVYLAMLITEQYFSPEGEDEIKSNRARPVFLEGFGLKRSLVNQQIIPR